MSLVVQLASSAFGIIISIIVLIFIVGTAWYLLWILILSRIAFVREVFGIKIDSVPTADKSGKKQPPTSPLQYAVHRSSLSSFEENGPFAKSHFSTAVNKPARTGPRVTFNEKVSVTATKESPDFAATHAKPVTTRRSRKHRESITSDGFVLIPAEDEFD